MNSRPPPLRVAILSDVHYAGAAEQARGEDYEYGDLKNPFLRMLVAGYRHHIWLRHPHGQNARLAEFIAANPAPDLVVANGDYNTDTAFVGVSDSAAQASAQECLATLRQHYGTKFHAIIGDHELGKLSLIGGRGGLRRESLRVCQEELGLAPFWQLELGNYLLLGVTSTLIALPLFTVDVLPQEAAAWHKLREEHLAQIRAAFSRLRPDQKVLLFCHDPSALPFLGRDEIISGKMNQIEHTILGHLHSRLVFKTSRVLSGLPAIPFLGHTVKRLSRALTEARHWRPFKPLLCPSLAGIELLKDGGYLTAELDLNATTAARFRLHPLTR